MPSTFLVFGATGGTGRHFVKLALDQGHSVKALVRNPAKLSSISDPRLQVYQASITDDPIPCLEECVKGTDYVVAMLGDASMQKDTKVNTAFVKKQLVPAMRRNGVKRFLYQAGGLSRPYKTSSPILLRALRYAVGSALMGMGKEHNFQILPCSNCRSYRPARGQRSSHGVPS